MYDNCKGNKDYDLKSNNEIAKVEQLEIEIGKSMMSSVFWEMWNKNHGEIDEKVWVNQKNKKMKDEIRVCDLYLIGAKKHNTKRDEESQNQDQLVPNRSCVITFLELYEISMIIELYEISMSSMRFLCFLSFRLSTREW